MMAHPRMAAGVTLYFVRHGETDWNAERRYQGQRDIPLNATGRAQAKRNGEALRAIKDHIQEADYVASPLGRARETMEILRGSIGLETQAYRTDERLKELSYGTWEGQLQTELPVLDPAGWGQRGIDPYRWRPTGGESYEDLLVRAAGWLQDVKRDTVVASHGGVSRVLRGHVLDLETEAIPELDSPQDQVLVLTANGMRWL
jgi:broad specificity phosphatase PhoE